MDTDTCIFLIRHHPPEARERFQAIGPTHLFISTVTLFELAYGAERSRRQAHNRACLQRLVALLNLVPFDTEAAWTAARLRAELAAAGTPIGPYDVQIAAIALSRNMTLVSNNLREFRRIADLRSETWVLPA
ncbi:PIN domain-containing protein [Methylomarinovum tepidoasis]|uniref:PIN domain-containing protein n=1 Tax=Methylomarinovum tepidoasis TaxID=2840183 RepID=UPI00257457A7|nr:PIN domain-containing protein [Methylomarinovum sp. IN45]